jgi:small subunit ribosomal protein S20
MPVIKSAIKQAKKSVERRERRLPYKTRMKTMMRKISDLTRGGKIDDAIAMLPNAFKAIDMAAKKNIIHPKNAARKKSLLARMTVKKSK